MPDDIFANIEIDRMGNPITKDWVCEELGCTELEPDKAHNIIGKILLLRYHCFAPTVKLFESVMDLGNDQRKRTAHPW